MNMKIMSGLLIGCYLCLIGSVFGQESYRTIENIYYQEGDQQTMTEYMKERCLLDLYLPSDKTG